MIPLRLWTVNSLLLPLLLFSCGPQVQTPPDTLVVGLEAIPKTPDDPRLAMADAYSSKIANLIFGSLFRINERMEVVPDLVASTQWLPPVTYRFELKSGIQFHNGKPLTAEDVKKTLESILDPATASPHRGTLGKIQTIRVTAPLSLEVVLTEPFAPFLTALTFGILPNGNQTGIGTGPYRLEKIIPAQSILLIKNENYYGPPPKMDRIEFRMVPDDNVRVLELMGGQIDFLQNNVPPALVDALRRRSGLNFIATQGINYSYLGMNLEVPPLNDLRVRQAIRAALDIPSIIAYRMGGLAEPATGLLPPLHWAYEAEVAKFPYDPSRARQLLDQTGYPDPDGAGPQTRFQLTYKTSSRKDRIGMARLIARYLREVGIGVQVLPFEWGTFFHDIQTGNFQLYSLTWVGVSDPDIYYYAFHSSQRPPHGGNRGGYQNPVIDRLTEEGRQTLELRRRQELYSSVQKILAQDLPYLSLWYEKNYALYQKNLQGVRLRPDGGFEILTEVTK